MKKKMKTSKNKKTGVLVNSREKAYFERVIDDHEHLLEGFFTIEQKEEELIFGQMNEIKAVFEIPYKFSVKDTISININDSINHFDKLTGFK